MFSSLNDKGTEWCLNLVYKRMRSTFYNYQLNSHVTSKKIIINKQTLKKKKTWMNKFYALHIGTLQHEYWIFGFETVCLKWYMIECRIQERF